MFLKQFSIPAILYFLFIFTLNGCASTTKAFVPEQLAKTAEGHARIIVTRENQLAGQYTPLYIVDIANDIKTNAAIAVRVGEWSKEPGLHLWYTPGMMNSYSQGSFMVMPTSNITFRESELSLDDLLNKNLNAVIYVDYLNCAPDNIPALYCGDGSEQCDTLFSKQLEESRGIILNKLGTDADKNNLRQVQVIGKIGVGDTLIWDRKPGLMRIGALWGDFTGVDNTLLLMPGNIMVEIGKTYYLKYETNLGNRWSITRVE
ncbi:MAG: hypothetical protein OQL06_16240 [Gammaproteobacteria bacterium]|nr:hypothetical protein [Gammaproteobacteria bacterium]